MFQKDLNFSVDLVFREDLKFGSLTADGWVGMVDNLIQVIITLVPQ